MHAIEVGALGHMAYTLKTVLQELSFTANEVTRIKREVEDAARRCSYTLYLCRRQVAWHRPEPLDAQKFAAIKDTAANEEEEEEELENLAPQAVGGC